MEHPRDIAALSRSAAIVVLLSSERDLRRVNNQGRPHIFAIMWKSGLSLHTAQVWSRRERNGTCGDRQHKGGKCGDAMA